jgi:hypothetical protein
MDINLELTESSTAEHLFSSSKLVFEIVHKVRKIQNHRMSIGV